MIIQPLRLPSVTAGPTMQEGRAVPDGQVQPFDVGSVQIPRILRGVPPLVPTPSRADSGLPLHTNHAIIPSFLDDLTVQARCAKKASNDLPMELESSAAIRVG